MFKPQWVFIALSLLLCPDVLAQTAIKFTSAELAAAGVLVKPELNSLELDDQSGTFSPGPSLLALGVTPLRFDIDFTGLTDLANIHFDHLRAVSPNIKFEGTDLVVSVQIENKSRGVQSRLGSINFENVILKARVSWRQRADGSSELYLRATESQGSITGTGLLKPSFMIAMVRKLLHSIMGKQVSRIIDQDSVRNAVPTGLLTWAKVSTGQEWRTLVPASIEFYTEGGESGLRYHVQ